MLETIVNSFDIWTDAQGLKSKGRVNNIENISLEGIARLRELILELAILGKLVPQDPNDEPASVLLKSIEKERDVSNTAKKRKKEEPVYSGKIFNFKIPGWELCKLEDIGDTNIGLTYSPNDVSDKGTIVLRSSNIQNGEIELSDIVRVNKKINENVLVKQGDLLICARNGSKKLVGKCALIRNLPEPMAFGAFMAIFRSPFNEYCRIFIESPLYRRNLEGVTTTTINQITQENLKNTHIPLPPLAEQHRIIAKVDELMALCDKLEGQQFNNLKTHQVLVKTLLETLTQAADANELQAAWERMATHFDTLFCTDDSIDQLKQTILQLAVMGKLVKQDPTDEPASELLGKIAKAKDKLVEEANLKKQAQLPKINEDEKPFDLPVGWEFCRLESLCSLITKGSSPKWQGVSYTENPDDVLFITSENVGSYRLLLDSKKYVELKFNEIEPRSVLERGDFLMNIVGGSIGRTAIYNIDDLANINQAVCLIRMIPGYIDEQFFLHFFNSSICVSYMFDKQVDNARANLSMGNISRFVIPLPSLSEQKRIVDKVESSFILCDLMKEKIFKAQEIKVLLSKTIVEKAVE